MSTPAVPATDVTYRPTTAVTVTVCGVAFLYSLLESMLIPALPLIQDGVGATPASIAWVFTGLMLSGAISVPLVGRLADLYDRSKVFLVVLAIIAAGVLLAAVAPSVVFLAVGQVLQGVGAGLVPLAFVVFKDTQPAAKAKNSNGLVIGLSALGSVVGPMVSGSVVKALSYHWLYVLPLIGLVVFGLLGLRVLPADPSRGEGRVDWTGAALLGGALLALLLGLTEAPTWGWTSAGFLALAAAAVALLVGFVVVELRSDEPLIDLRGGGRPVLVTCAVTFAVGWSTIVAYTVIPRIVAAPPTSGYGLAASTTLTGLLIVPVGLIGGIAAPFTSRLERLVGAKPLMVASCLPIVGSSAVLLAGRHSFVVLAVAAVLMGLGLGFGLTQAMNIVAAHVSADRVASATGLVVVARAVGGTVGAQTAGSMLASDLVAGTKLPTWSAFTWVFLLAIAVSLLALVLSASLPKRMVTA